MITDEQFNRLVFSVQTLTKMVYDITMPKGISFETLANIDNLTTQLSKLKALEEILGELYITEKNKEKRP